MTKDLSNAISLVSNNFIGNCDKGGEPYILHCLREERKLVKKFKKVLSWYKV